MPTRTPSAPAPTPVREVAPTVWLIDVGTAEVTSLVDRDEAFPLDVRFEADGITAVRYHDYEVRFAPDGTEVSRVPEVSACRPLPGGRAEVDGEELENITCGGVSPRGLWQSYTVITGEFTADSGYSVPQYDQWMLDLQTLERRRLVEALRTCGGCEYYYGFPWSFDGRYFAAAESYGGPGGGRVYLVDASSGNSRLIAGGDEAGYLSSQPAWSANSSALLHRGADDSEVLVIPLGGGDPRRLESLSWPASFDASGQYAYSPAGVFDGQEAQLGETTLVDLQTGSVVATIDGFPPDERLAGPPMDAPIRVVGETIIAVLEGVEGCLYIGVMVDGEVVGCLDRAMFPAISPDGTKVAFARPNGLTGRVGLPTFDVEHMTIYDVVLYDIETNTELILASGAISGTVLPLRWNPDSTHITALWPSWLLRV